MHVGREQRLRNVVRTRLFEIGQKSGTLTYSVKMDKLRLLDHALHRLLIQALFSEALGP